MFPISFLVSPSPSHRLASPTSISTLILCGGVRAICLSKIKIKSDGGCSKTRKVICYLSELWALVNPAINNVFSIWTERVRVPSEGWSRIIPAEIQRYFQACFTREFNSKLYILWTCLVIFVCRSVFAVDTLLRNNFISFISTNPTYLWNFFVQLDNR